MEPIELVLIVVGIVFLISLITILWIAISLDCDNIAIEEFNEEANNDKCL